MKSVLISSFDLEVGGVERSLISMLENFNYKDYDVDLMLYRHKGEFMPLIPEGPNLLPEVPEYRTFRESISEIIKDRKYKIGLARVAAKYVGNTNSYLKGFNELGLISMQLGWKFANPFLPKNKKEYDLAISYLWPHYFISEKVNAKVKIAWVHTDYSQLQIDNRIDSKMWEKFDWIVAVSEGCKESFLKRYPQFIDKTIVIENITSIDFIKKMADLERPEEIKINMGKTNLITVARLAYAKGIDDAVRACRQLLDEGYNITWYVVGYGTDEKEIRELINKLKVSNNFILLGKKINPYPYIKACDIYVQPSRYEGKAVTVTEAQVLGKPVVITNYNTAKSQVKDGFDGIITDLGVGGIVDGIKTLIDNPELRKKFEFNTGSYDYGNSSELYKLYNLFE